MKLIFLPTDILIYLLIVVSVSFFIWSLRYEHWRTPWRQVLHNKLGMTALVIITTYALTGFLDSIHWQVALKETNAKQKQTYSLQIKSALDLLISPLGTENEETYSAPFATHLYAKSIIKLPSGQTVRDYPRLIYGGKDLSEPQQKAEDIAARILSGALIGLVITSVLALVSIGLTSWRYKQNIFYEIKRIALGKTWIAWREFWLTFTIIILTICICAKLAAEYHILGTDKVGNDIFYEAIKSIRTGLIIGTLTTLIMLPFAVILGMLAGYFGGRLDDVIQFVYTTLSSIPAVLLITASILALQVYIENHAELFPNLAIRADVRLLALCLALGITSWASLCRLLRGETLKLREMDYVAAAITLGSKKVTILLRHILPNLMHIILITVVLDFSGLVLAEAVLSYVGVGVDPTMLSWGNMINAARLELAREPIVWWPLLAAFIFMFMLVLAANLFADAVRDAFDPRLKSVE